MPRKSESTPGASTLDKGLIFGFFHTTGQLCVAREKFQREVITGLEKVHNRPNPIRNLIRSRRLQGVSHCDIIADSAEQYVDFFVAQATPKASSRDDIIQASSQINHEGHQGWLRRAVCSGLRSVFHGWTLLLIKF